MPCPELAKGCSQFVTWPMSPLPRNISGALVLIGRARKLASIRTAEGDCLSKIRQDRQDSPDRFRRRAQYEANRPDVSHWHIVALDAIFHKPSPLPNSIPPRRWGVIELDCDHAYS